MPRALAGAQAPAQEIGLGFRVWGLGLEVQHMEGLRQPTSAQPFSTATCRNQVPRIGSAPASEGIGIRSARSPNFARKLRLRSRSTPTGPLTA